MHAVRRGLFWSVFTVLLTLSLHEVGLSMGDGFSDMVPVVEMGKVKTMIVMNPLSRRKLSAFEQCSPCKCCVDGNSNSKSCKNTTCCYGINCNMPNKPFGTCAFAPKACGCSKSNCNI